MNNGMNDATKIFELYVESKEEPIMNTRSDGTKEWRLHGKLHREGAPAIEYADGDKMWFINGELHREDGPAVEYANDDKMWYINDKLHREDGPAIEFAGGEKRWCLHGKLHREDGPAIEWADGDKSWYINGKLYDDISAWAEAVLHHQNKPTTQDNVDEMIAQVMQQDLFS